MWEGRREALKGLCWSEAMSIDGIWDIGVLIGRSFCCFILYLSMPYGT